MFWFQHNADNAQFWDKHFPTDFPFDREESSETESPANPTMYPFRTKVAERGVQEEVVEWSETELRRIFGGDVERMRRLRREKERVEGFKEENAERKVLKELRRIFGGDVERMRR